MAASYGGGASCELNSAPLYLYQVEQELADVVAVVIDTKKQ